MAQPWSSTVSTATCHSSFNFFNLFGPPYLGKATYSSRKSSATQPYKCMLGLFVFVFCCCGPAFNVWRRLFTITLSVHASFLSTKRCFTLQPWLVWACCRVDGVLSLRHRHAQVRHLHAARALRLQVLHGADRQALPRTPPTLPARSAQLLSFVW